MAEVWGIVWDFAGGGDCEIRGDICKVQACNYSSSNFLGRGRFQGQGKGEGKGRAACQLVSRIDMWDFGSLQMASACERGGIRCGRIGFRRGLEEPACQTWSYNEPEVLSSFHPGLWFVSGGGSAALEEARYGRWAAAEGGGGGQRHSESKTWPFQLALLHRVLKCDRRCKLQNPNCTSELL